MKDETLSDQISAISKKAKHLALKGNYVDAIDEYQKGIDLVGPNIMQSKYAVMLFCGIGEIYFLQRQWNDALQYFGKAIQSEGGLGEPYIHLRLGQIRLELGQLKKATDELMRAYMGGGKLIFQGEDSKYFETIQSLL